MQIAVRVLSPVDDADVQERNYNSVHKKRNITLVKYFLLGSRRFIDCGLVLEIYIHHVRKLQFLTPSTSEQDALYSSVSKHYKTKLFFYVR